ncbi:reverse transcriptase domain-containing protein [Tanacetum coccineum]
MKEVHYHSWLSNPVMVKKHDGSWRMCVDFKDLNKACPKDGYPLSEIDWKVESFCGYPFKCFLETYKGYHQIKMAEEDEEKKSFITSQGIFCYSKMPFGLKNVGATYQLLVVRAFQKQIGCNLEVYVDDLVGMFLGYKVNADGLKVCPDKADAVLSVPYLGCLKDVQKLNGKLANSGSRSSLQTDEETHRGSPNADRTKGNGGANHVLSRDQGSYQCSLNDRKRGQANVSVLCEPRPTRARDQLHPYRKTGVSLAQRKQAAENILPGTNNCCNHRSADKATAVKLRNHRKDAKEECPDELMAEPEELPEPWTLFTDGSSCIDGSGAGLILTNPEGVELTYAMRFRFEATNNEAEYEALIASLWITGQIGVKNLQANVDSLLVANQANGSYVAKESGMVQYLEKVKTLTSNFKEFSIKQVPRSENKKADALSKIASTSFTHLSKQVFVEELNEKSINEKEVLTIVEEEGHIWMTPICKYLTKEILPKDKKKARVVPRKASRFGLPGEIVSDNGKQFRDNPFKDWREKLSRLDERSKDWIGELSHVLWAHRTMIKSSNGETLFSLTYATEAVIPAEIGMPTLQTAEVDLIKNDEELEINLDLIEEKREQAAIQKAKSKAKMEKYYNSKVRGTSFKPGDMVYCSNDASHAKDGGKLGPKWEGPYEVTESLGKGAYKLKDDQGNELPRTWNICNLKKCYIHEV